MKIAILGYGKMGKAIEKEAIKKNHSIDLKIDDSNLKDLTIENLKKVDLAFEFSTPDTAFKNINLCFDADIPVVSGATGWLDKYNDVINRCKQENKAFFYASNFSIGVNIFFKLNQYLSKIMNNFNEFDIEISETHHIHKLDAPSGTAISLANDNINNIKRKTSWVKENPKSDDILINSFREGEIAGIHEVKFESEVEKIEIKHSSKSREGLAKGAILAAEFVINKKGSFTMDELLKL
ncbi:MAG: 4-hydroxy-tetrahydrodipicolinate reductase [Bacteroidales bacterium]|nr:4-hydroxy-tetrahydrodipicolinate reductase [Bacteroidales bacterium]MBN2757305.1 4-hydroxy-tetrahydrodipicolinate reductase [Bacteroidales bacterium]